MRFLSLFSGIEAASVAWMPLGWQCVAVAEVDKFCNAVLANKYPTVLNIGDVNGITQEQIEALRPIELVIGGSPCQGFSVTGKRGGLDDSRSNLAIRFCELVAAMRPRWIVWENVPGVRSMWRSKTKPPRANQKGKVWQGTEKSDFGFFMDALAKCGYGLAYRSLDAQFSGLAQRRERVFLVGYLGDWRPAAAVLFERGGLSRHNPPSREAGQDSAPTLSSRTKGGGGLGTDTECDGGLIAPVGTQRANGGRGSRQDKQPMIACPITGNPYGDNESRESLLIHSDAVSIQRHAHGVRMDMESETFVTHALRANGFDGSEDGSGRGTPLVFDAKQSGQNGEVAPPLRAMNANAGNANAGGQLAVAYRTSGNCGVLEQGSKTAALNCATDPNQQIIQQRSSVRRLTPMECERLQGFPDGWTQVPYRGKPACDGPRYKSLGNSIATPCLRWIGERIMQVERLMTR